MSVEYHDEVDTPESENLARDFPIPTPVYTLVILVCIGAAMVAQFYAGLERSTIIAGFVKPYFLDGEYWRILTGAVVHAGPVHILMNGYALFGFGKLMELLANRAHLAIVFLLSAIGGGLLSLFFNPDGVSVGASGGIVGLIGYLVVYAFRRRKFISAEFRKSLLINIAFILVFGLVLFQVIDNYGHIGGLLTGVFYAFVQIPSDEYVNPHDASGPTKLLGILALGLYVAASVFTIMLLIASRP